MRGIGHIGRHGHLDRHVTGLDSRQAQTYGHKDRKEQYNYLSSRPATHSIQDSSKALTGQDTEL